MKIGTYNEADYKLLVESKVSGLRGLLPSERIYQSYIDKIGNLIQHAYLHGVEDATYSMEACIEKIKRDEDNDSDSR